MKTETDTGLLALFEQCVARELAVRQQQADLRQKKEERQVQRIERFLKNIEKQNKLDARIGRQAQTITKIEARLHPKPILVLG